MRPRSQVLRRHRLRLRIRICWCRSRSRWSKVLSFPPKLRWKFIRNLTSGNIWPGPNTVVLWILLKILTCKSKSTREQERRHSQVSKSSRKLSMRMLRSMSAKFNWIASSLRLKMPIRYLYLPTSKGKHTCTENSWYLCLWKVKRC